MDPKVTRITEAQQIAANGQVSKVLQIQFMVGTHGPFTITAAPEDLHNGKAIQQMQQLANGINALPQIPQVAG
jgi:septal ring factor EnvC (AmiA/AmiB activator)